MQHIHLLLMFLLAHANSKGNVSCIHYRVNPISTPGQMGSSVYVNTVLAAHGVEALFVFLDSSFICAGKLVSSAASRACVCGLVVGKDCLVSTDAEGKVLEWKLPDPRTTVEAKPWVASKLSRLAASSRLMCMQVCLQPPGKKYS
jgi:hypothetical protein